MQKQSKSLIFPVSLPLKKYLVTCEDMSLSKGLFIKAIDVALNLFCSISSNQAYLAEAWKGFSE